MGSRWHTEESPYRKLCVSFITARKKRGSRHGRYGGLKVPELLYVAFVFFNEQ